MKTIMGRVFLLALLLSGAAAAAPGQAGISMSDVAGEASSGDGLGAQAINAALEVVAVQEPNSLLLLGLGLLALGLVSRVTRR